MPEPKRKPVEKVESNLGLEGFETFFEGASQTDKSGSADATVAGEAVNGAQIEKLIDRFSQLITFSVDQRVETATIANQLIENQRQLIATQQILIRLMEKSIEMTRHITSIEEKLPALFEIPRTVEALRVQVAKLEGVETA
jgi:hypothetical protein